MIWFFHKGRDELRLETRFDGASGQFIAHVHHADGTTESDRFNDEERFRAHLQDLELRLNREHWRRARAPIVIPT